MLVVNYGRHGSTRGLADDLARIIQEYSYNAYGNAIGFVPKNALTNLLYSGEQYNPVSNLQYLRARWYNPENGRFNRLDPYAGNKQSPLSFHKYAYAHMNPIMGIDPTGEDLISLLVGLTFRGIGAYARYQKQIGIIGVVLNSISTVMFLADAAQILFALPTLENIISTRSRGSNVNVQDKISKFRITLIKEMAWASARYALTAGTASASLAGKLLPGIPKEIKIIGKFSFLASGASLLGIAGNVGRKFHIGQQLILLFNDMLEATMFPQGNPMQLKIITKASDMAFDFKKYQKYFFTSELFQARWLDRFMQGVQSNDVSQISNLYSDLLGTMLGSVSY